MEACKSRASRSRSQKVKSQKSVHSPLPTHSAATAPSPDPSSKIGAQFGDLGLSPTMLAALAKAEYLSPTPVQAGLIPRALALVDVMGQARTGTGKTAAFVIPILEQLEEHERGRGPRAIVLVPTRELAVQVKGEADKLAYGRKLHIVAIYGGKPIKGQIEKLRRGADIIIGTPGRVLDHLARGTLALGDAKIVVLDEADRMLDIGFRPDIEKILRRAPQSRQTLLLSATVPPPVQKLAERYMRDPESLDFSPTDIASETIEQFYFTVDPERKFELLERLLKREEPRQAIIFCRTKRGTDKIHHRLSRKFKDAACIHGDLGQSARDRVMREFREGKVRYLVATDVVGRGIDVSGISHIINYDVPQFSDDYVHRVGRTGRMGREGVAYTFITPEEGNELTRIEIRINKLLTRDEIKDFESFAQKRGIAPPPPLPSVAAHERTDRAKPSGSDHRAAETPAVAESPPAPKPKPFGGRTRRYRRAL
jgi:ATP-dependent RNA helicase DeaD